MSSVSYFYRLKGLPSPSDNPFVSMYIKGLKRERLTLSAPVKRAKPMTTAILHQMIAHLNAEERGLRVWRTVWRANLAFYCLLRWDDVMRLQVTQKHSKYLLKNAKPIRISGD
jgi:hypothetical protein